MDFLRKDFSRSSLVRLLGDWAPVEALANQQDIAQRLSQWLDVSDAITLHAAHQSITPAAPAKPPAAHAGQASQTRALAEECQRVRTALVKAITAGGATAPARKRHDRGLLPTTAAAPEADAGFGPHQQRYLEQQRQMALRIEALRAHVRHAVAEASPRLAPLAAMDAVLEPLFGAREQQLMGTVPVLLERRFDVTARPRPRWRLRWPTCRSPWRTWTTGWPRASGVATRCACASRASASPCPGRR
jgi:hypothetical protein